MYLTLACQDIYVFEVSNSGILAENPDIAIENVKWPVNINLRKNPRQVLQFKVSIRNRGNIKSPNSVLELRMANFILKNVKIPHLNPNGTYAVYVRIPAKIAINHISHRLVQKSSFVRTELNLMRWPLECEFRNNSKSKSIRLYR